jgi:trk system potassium uptake protein TrkH
MAGSTAGGIKMMRLTLLFKHMAREMKLLLHPNAIVAVRLDERVVQNGIMRTIISFTMLYVTMGMIGFVFMSALGLDLESAIGVVVSSLGNIGPAFGEFGPTEVYTSIPDVGKWFLAILMLVGRLEIYTVLILFIPSYWNE